MTARSRHVVLVVVVALAGLGFAVGLAILASSLTTQHLGLAGESPAAGTQLVSRGPEEAPSRTVKPPARHAKPTHGNDREREGAQGSRGDD